MMMIRGIYSDIIISRGMNRFIEIEKKEGDYRLSSEEDPLKIILRYYLLTGLGTRL
jgi:hypothetical protein